MQRGFTLDLIIASSLQRANETARIIASTYHMNIESDPDWMEWDNGPLAGLLFDVAEERFPQPDFITPYMPQVGSGKVGGISMHGLPGLSRRWFSAVLVHIW